jgi:hypothetical protein
MARTRSLARGERDVFCADVSAPGAYRGVGRGGGVRNTGAAYSRSAHTARAAQPDAPGRRDQSSSFGPNTGPPFGTEHRMVHVGTERTILGPNAQFVFLRKKCWHRWPPPPPRRRRRRLGRTGLLPRTRPLPFGTVACATVGMIVAQALALRSRLARRGEMRLPPGSHGGACEGRRWELWCAGAQGRGKLCPTKCGLYSQWERIYTDPAPIRNYLQGLPSGFVL